MDAAILVNRILDDERLTADLEGDDAETMVRWLVARAEAIAIAARSEAQARAEVETLCARAQVIGRVVRMLREGDGDGARNFAAAQGLAVPGELPANAILQKLLENCP